ncbi:glycosyltransferase family 9 protein [Georgenia sp. TF02-10]|uniref:glycosyltransferase family 9 protein n=1 Tax=Georgenia sp. TF02-10 TaxID=2917725 RepID=UPI002738DB39|nr:glycosyltransferase family 9 protein [Georgenia sp. TF02-10]
MTRVLAVRLDSDGDVLLAGPAVRALAATAAEVDLLVSPAGRAAAELLPAVRAVHVFDAPWSGYAPPPVDPAGTADLVAALADRRYDRCLIFTSFHQSPLPMALLARLAGIGYVAATSEDYPGSLLDLRHRRLPGLHEAEAALDLACAAGGAVPAGDDGRLAVRGPLPDVAALVPAGRYVVLHPGASVPARAVPAAHAAALAAALRAAGWSVVVTGAPAEAATTAAVTALAADGAPAADQAGTSAADHDGTRPAGQDRTPAGHPAGVGGEDDGASAPTTPEPSPAPSPGTPATTLADLGGRTTLPELAAVLAGADAVVVGNTGPAHLAAAVGTPVVSLFSPVVPAERWAPWGVPTVLLGDQDAACRGSRARECPVPGHPCLTSVTPAEVVAAVRSLVGAGVAA